MASLVSTGPDMSAFIDAVSPKPGDAITSWMTLFGPGTIGPNMNALNDTVSPTVIDDLIKTPWIRPLGSGDIHSPLLDEALSSTDLVEEILSGLEAVNVPEFSASTLPVETSPTAPMCDRSDLYETAVNFTKWPWDAEDFVAVLVTIGFMPLVLLFHMQGHEGL
jgi:hypothetical protein